MTKLIVAIATSGRPSLLRRTLDSLSRCARPTNYAGTIVIENGPAAGVESITRDYSVEYLYTPIGNKSQALNHVLDHVGDVRIYFSDDDIRFDPNVLSAIASAAGDKTEGEFFGGSVRIDFEQEPPDWIKALLPPSARGRDVSDEAAWRRWPFFLGCNWAAFASDLRRAGGFDPTRGPGSATNSVGQEHAMQARLRQAGVLSRRVPEAVVWHWVPRDRCSPDWILRRQYRNGISAGLRLLAARNLGLLTPLMPWLSLLRSLPLSAVDWVRGDPGGRLRAKARLQFVSGMLAAGRNKDIAAGPDSRSTGRARISTKHSHSGEP